MARSGRSVPGIDLHEALNRCSHLMEKWGGHAQAAGLSLRREREAEFRTLFVEAIAQARSGVSTEGPAGECRAELAEVDGELLGWLERMEPWGPRNPAPMFWSESVEVVSVSKVGEGKHLRLSLRQGGHQVDGIGFGMGAEGSRLAPGQQVRVAFHAEWNEFRGRRQVQLRLKEVR